MPGEIYIKNEYGRSIITYNDSPIVTLQVELHLLIMGN